MNDHERIYLQGQRGDGDRTWSTEPIGDSGDVVSGNTGDTEYVRADLADAGRRWLGLRRSKRKERASEQCRPITQRT